jgi:hypothetical protein
MSNYEIGAFEALEWAWYMLRNYKNNPQGVDEARKEILQILNNMGKGYEVNFKEYIPQRWLSD